MPISPRPLVGPSGSKPDASWPSAIASVSGTGVVTGLTAGTATISATGEGKVGTATVTVLQAPIAGTLVAAAPVRIEVEWPGASEMALVTNGEWTKLQRNGSRFTGEVVAAGSSVTLVGRPAASAPYATLLHYNVRGGARPRASTK